MTKMAAPAKDVSDNNLSYFNGICFLSNEDFDHMVAIKRVAEEAIGWKLLPENTVYRVENMSPIQTKWESRCILQLRDVNGQDINVWGPSNVVHDLKSGFKLNGKDCLAFIKPLGEKETNIVGESKKKFFDYETVYLPSFSTTNNSNICLLYTSPSPRDRTRSRMPSSA